NDHDRTDHAQSPPIDLGQLARECAAQVGLVRPAGRRRYRPGPCRHTTRHVAIVSRDPSARRLLSIGTWALRAAVAMAITHAGPGARRRAGTVSARCRRSGRITPAVASEVARLAPASRGTLLAEPRFACCEHNRYSRKIALVPLLSTRCCMAGTVAGRRAGS